MQADLELQLAVLLAFLQGRQAHFEAMTTLTDGIKNLRSHK